MLSRRWPLSVRVTPTWPTVPNVSNS
jgi:hypothetical protein